MPLRTDSYHTDSKVYVMIYQPGLTPANITVEVCKNPRLIKLTFHDASGELRSSMSVAITQPAASVHGITSTSMKLEVCLLRDSPRSASPAGGLLLDSSPAPLLSSSELADAKTALALDSINALRVTTSSPVVSIFDDIGSLFGNAEKEYDSAAKEEATALPPLERLASGLVGLANLGNTCFMNSTLQCLAGALDFTRFFTSDDYVKDVNETNPLGMKGKLAFEYAKLMRRVWAPDAASYVSPTSFKTAVGRFRPQFSGHQQHDSQEVLAFLLDGLHEDLNRVLTKPYTENPTYIGQPDRELAAACWATHRRRNDSVVVDLFQGQYKSTVTCCDCKKVSVAFDPFMFLSLPLPQPIPPINVNLTLLAGGVAQRLRLTIEQREPTARHVCAAIAAASPGVHPDRLVLLEHDNGSVDVIYKPDDVIKTTQMLHAFEVSDDPFGDNSVVVVAVNRSLGSDIYYCYECSQTSQPLTPCEKCRAVGYCSDTCRERDSNHRLTCYARYSAFGQPWVAVVRGEEGLTPARIKKGFVEGVARNIRDERGEKWGQEGCFPVRFARNGQVVAMEEEVAIEVSAPGLLGLTADWDHKDMVEYYDFSKARDYVIKYDVPPPTRVSLSDCMHLSFEQELLEDENAWYCSDCKTHRSASKQLQLWSLPPVLIIHLKRFSSGRSQHYLSSLMRSKLATPVDYPLSSLDMSEFVLDKDGAEAPIYDLFGVSHHFGSTSGGHYTAHGLREVEGGASWYYFDDDRVSPASPADVMAATAYVLFYKRRKAGDAQPPSDEGISR